VPEWTPEKIRKWIFEKLYPAYMKNARGHMIFNDKPGEDPEPPLKATIRECKLMETMGHVEILGEAWGSIRVRLTVSGRLFWEKPPQPPGEPRQPPAEPEERKPIGF